MGGVSGPRRGSRNARSPEATIEVTRPLPAERISRTRIYEIGLKKSPLLNREIIKLDVKVTPKHPKYKELMRDPRIRRAIKLNYEVYEYSKSMYDRFFALKPDKKTNSGLRRIRQADQKSHRSVS